MRCCSLLGYQAFDGDLGDQVDERAHCGFVSFWLVFLPPRERSVDVRGDDVGRLSDAARATTSCFAPPRAGLFLTDRESQRNRSRSQTTATNGHRSNDKQSTATYFDEMIASKRRDDPACRASAYSLCQSAICLATTRL